MNDGKWRHVCLTWSSAAGTWNIYLDGALRGDGRSLGTGLSIKGGGRLVLGQHQGSNSSLSLIGNITQCNLWDQVIEQPIIKNMSRYCYSNESIGDVVFWSEFQMQISGQAQIKTHSSCNTTSKLLEIGRQVCIIRNLMQ